MDPPSDHSFPSGKVQQRFTSIPWGNPCGSNSYSASSDASLFSSSLPDFSNAKWNLTTLEHRVQSINDASLELSEYRDAECKDSVDDLDIECIGSRLPGDEDELLAGIIDELHLSHLPCQVEDLEECDVFSSGGGMELESDPTESITLGMSKTNINDGYAGNGNVNHGLRNCVGSVAGEHPHGEHPSRTLFVRNINSNVEDSELLSLFEQYGKIRSLYTACKHRGFVMISYYDIRDARNAMKALQNKPLRRRKLDIHFSIPKDNPSDKDLNQGTLVIFNLDPSVSNDDLLRIFGVYGEVKEIRETPHKRHHKFIEYYDVRAAEAACRSLNRSDIAGKRIKLEPSRPGGARRKQSGTELEQDEARGYMHQVGSPLSNSPPGRWADIGSPSDSSLQAHSHFSTVGSSRLLPGLASISPSMISNPGQKLVIGKDQGQVNHVNHLLSNNNHMWNISSGSQNTQPFVSQTSDASVTGVLTGSQFLWGSPTFSEHARTAGRAEWPIGCPFTSIPQQQAFTCSNRGRTPHPSPYYHVGSAPPGLPFERHFGHLPAESLEASFMNQVAFGTMTNMWNDSRINMSISSGPPRHPGVPLSRAISENHSAGYKLVSSQKYDNVFLRNHSLYAPGSIGFDTSLECNQCRHVDNNGKLDGKTQYQLDLEKIESGEDTRTTIMIKNIPNKYTSNMLLAAIDESSKGTYDFFYLPIDFKNRCNMGYAFINMLSSLDIIPLYQAFDGKKWEKFNSEKVASLAYARIQGKTALVNHFQYSSLMNEDKRCRPILFHHGAVEAGDKERCPRSGINICIHRQEGTCLTDLPENQVKDVQNQKPETCNTAGIGSGERQ